MQLLFKGLTPKTRVHQLPRTIKSHSSYRLRELIGHTARFQDSQLYPLY